MKYMFLIYDDETRDENITPEGMDEMMAAYYAFQEYLDANGKAWTGEALNPTPTATTVRVRNESSLTTDGPFAETKEQLGGFYVIECTDLDDAIGIAARIPGASTGCVEIRPIIDFSGMQ